jgi:hypothetical protein
MKMKTQRAWIKSQLITRGTITRNACLNRFITRLAMHINKLKGEGWQIEGTRLPKRGGVDYRYTLISKPQ